MRLNYMPSSMLLDQTEDYIQVENKSGEEKKNEQEQKINAEKLWLKLPFTPPDEKMGNALIEVREGKIGSLEKAMEIWRELDQQNHHLTQELEAKNKQLEAKKKEVVLLEKQAETGVFYFLWTIMMCLFIVASHLVDTPGLILVIDAAKQKCVKDASQYCFDKGMWNYTTCKMNIKCDYTLFYDSVPLISKRAKCACVMAGLGFFLILLPENMNEGKTFTVKCLNVLVFYYLFVAELGQLQIYNL